MRLDDVLIYLLALVTGVTLFVGLARAFDDTVPRPRRSRRFRRPPLAWPPGPGRLVADASPSEAPLSPVGFSLLPEPRSRSERPSGLPPISERTAAPESTSATSLAVAASATTASVTEDRWVALEDVEVAEPGPDAPGATVEVEPVSLAASEETVRPAGPEKSLTGAEVAPHPVSDNSLEVKRVAPQPEPGLLGQCLALYEAAQHAEVVTAVGSRGGRSGGRRTQRAAGPESRGERGAILVLLGLSRDALGDAPGACAAFRMALGAVPDPKRPLAEPTNIGAWLGRRLLATGEAARPGSELRMTALRLAVLWLDAAQVSGSAADDVPALAERSRETFCAAAEERVNDLIRRREFAGAHALVEEILGVPAVPATRREAFRDLLWQSVSGEVGRLTGLALHAAPDGAPERDAAIASLQSAEAVIATAPEEILTTERRQDLARRLWWGYVKLATQRLDSGDLDGGLEPLFRALSLEEVDADRQAETRQRLARVVEGLVDRLGEESLSRLRDGDVAAAMAESRRLSEVVDGALERGLSQGDLIGALGRRQEIMLQLAGGVP